MISINLYDRREIAKAPLTIYHPQDWATRQSKAQLDNDRNKIARLTDSEAAEPGEINELGKPTDALPSFLQLDTSAQRPEIASVVANLARLEAYDRHAADEKARLIHLIETGQPLTAAAPAVNMPDPTVQPPLRPRRMTDLDSAGPVESRRFGTGPQQTGANMVPVAPRRLSGRVTADGPEDVRMSGSEEDTAGRRQSAGGAIDPRRNTRRR